LKTKPKTVYPKYLTLKPMLEHQPQNYEPQTLIPNPRHSETQTSNPNPKIFTSER